MTQTERSINELKLAGYYDSDSDYNGGIGKAVEELLLVFQKQEHSGMSASIVSAIFKHLVDGLPLGKIGLSPDEWVEVSSGILQNKRCGAIFSEDNGKTGYHIDGIVWEDEDGSKYTDRDSRVPLEFPCVVPKTIIKKKVLDCDFMESDK